MPVKFLNLGGGFRYPLFPRGDALDLRPSATICTNSSGRLPALPEASLVVSWAFIVGSSVYVCRVVDRKKFPGRSSPSPTGACIIICRPRGFGQVIRKNIRWPSATAWGFGHRAGIGCQPLYAPRSPGRPDGVAVAEVGDLVVVYQSGPTAPPAQPQAFLGHPAVRKSCSETAPTLFVFVVKYCV